MILASHCSGKYMAPNYYAIKHIWPPGILYIMWAWITIAGRFVLCHSLLLPDRHLFKTRHFKGQKSIFGYSLISTIISVKFALPTGHLGATVVVIYLFIGLVSDVYPFLPRLNLLHLICSHKQKTTLQVLSSPQLYQQNSQYVAI